MGENGAEFGEFIPHKEIKKVVAGSMQAYDVYNHVKEGDD